MTVTIGMLNLRDVLYICENMRSPDWAEVMNTVPRGINSPELVAMLCMQVSRLGLIAYLDDEPVAVVQYSEILDGSWRVGMFSTDKFHSVWRPLIRHLMQETMPYVLAQGVIYCDALADELHPEAHKLLEFFGFKKRAILEGFGSRGRDIALYVMTKGEADVLRDGRWRKLQQHSAS